jgi:hypothetical protein
MVLAFGRNVRPASSHATGFAQLPKNWKLVEVAEQQQQQ